MTMFRDAFGPKKLNKMLFLVLFLCFALALCGLGLVLPNIAEASAATTYPKQFCLRDDYYIGLTDQGQFGNCWTFANLKSVENFLAQTTGEHFELNESYIAMTRCLGPDDDKSLSENIIGAGGSVNDFIAAVNANGLIVDSEFEYQNFFYVNEANRQYLIDYLSDFADKDTIKIKAVEAEYYNDNQKNLIKSFLTNNKNASINISNWGLYRTASGKYEIVEGSSGAHALCVIGWDDNYLSLSGGRGAYLILNSYGLLNSDGQNSNDGILYLPYSTSLTYYNCTAFSYIFEMPDDYVALSSNANYSAQMQGKYYQSSNLIGQQSTLKDKNIFDVDDDFELEYSFPQKTDLTFDLQISRGNKNVSSDFFILKDDTNCYVYKKNPLQSGTYKIDINYSYTQNSKLVERHIIKQLFLLDGLEFDVIEAVLPDYKNMYNQIQSSSLAMVDENIYIPQYHAVSGAYTLRLAMSPYSKLDSLTLSKNGAQILTMSSPNTKDYLSIVIRTTFLFNSDNVFDLTLSNEKHQKTYKIHINYDQGQKFSTFFNVDLDGGEIEQNFPSQLLLTTASSSNHTMFMLRETPQKEGYEFLGYQYLNSNLTWSNVGVSPSGCYYVTADMILRSLAHNYFTYTHSGGSNFQNFMFVRATYAKSSSIQIDGDTFDFGKPISAQIDEPQATNIVWLLDGVEIGSGESVTLENLLPNNYLLTVKYSINGKNFQKNKQIFVKNHVFDVNFDKTDFVYDAILQRPTVTVEDLGEEDYQIELPNSIEAGNYCITLTTSAKNIKLSQNKIEYKIAKRPLQIEFDSQLIEEPGAPIAPITYRVTNWSENESEDLKVTFLNLDQISTEISGDFAVQYRFENVGESYQVEVTEQPYIYVKFDFDADAIQLCTSSVQREPQEEFAYGQNFVINFDCPSGMIESVQYTLNGKEYSIKQQYVDDRLPLGEHTIVGRATLINGETIEKSVQISVVKANITIVLDDQSSKKGDSQKKLTYNIVADYENFSPYGLSITPYVDGFDADKSGEYVISARVDGEIENYNISIVAGRYTVVGEQTLMWTIIILLSLALLAGITTVIVIVRKSKKKKKYDDV